MNANATETADTTRSQAAAIDVVLVSRHELHLRRIELRGYRRDDGLYDVEARKVDTKTTEPPAITCTSRAAVSRHRRLRCWSMHCIASSRPRLHHFRGSRRLPCARHFEPVQLLLDAMKGIVPDLVVGTHGENGLPGGVDRITTDLRPRRRLLIRCVGVACLRCQARSELLPKQFRDR